MRRFFADNFKGGDKSVELAGSELKHLKDVLRLKVGDEVTLFNGRGLEAEAVIEDFKKDAALLNINKIVSVVGGGGIKITLIQALTKGDVPERVIEKATELGADKVVFFIAKRSVPVLDEAKKEKKLEKFRKITIGAAKQCERTCLVDIEINSFEEAIKKASGLKICLYEESNEVILKDTLRDSSDKEVTLLIGPEGGLTEDEVMLAKDVGFKIVSLGTRVLRADTAAITALSVLQYELGDMG